MEILERKLLIVEREPTYTVKFADKVNLTTLTTHPRISFPFPQVTPPTQILSRGYDTVSRKGLATELGVNINELPDLLNHTQNVSSSSEGVCNVTGPLVLATHSHAGSHADQPHHWLNDPPFPSFDNRQYNGPTLILDLSSNFSDISFPRDITPSLLEKAMKPYHDPKDITRIILRTYERTPDQWDPKFAYLTTEAANFLGSLPSLVLLGTDAPSVDKADASPIHECAHGGLWSGRVAILEGLELSALPRRNLQGILQTTLLDVPEAKDAKTAICSFYPYS